MFTSIFAGQARDEVDRLIREQYEEDDKPKVLIERSVFTQRHFDESFEAGLRPSPTFRQIVSKKASKCICSAECVKSFIYGFLPCISTLKNYNFREDLSGDVVSGLTVGIMHIPQGLLL